MGIMDAIASTAVGVFNMDQQRQFNNEQGRLAREQLAFQQKLAEQGIQMKVADAQKAGINPLVALGASTFNPSPVSMGGEAPKLPESMGQGIDDAIQKSMALKERQDHDSEHIMRNQVEKGALENELLKTELVSRQARLAQSWTPPIPRPGPERTLSGFPIEGDKIKQKEDLAPESKRIPFLGGSISTFPGSADAQNLENRYGEWGGDILGLLNIPADVAHTMGQSHWWNFLRQKLRGPDLLAPGSGPRRRWLNRGHSWEGGE